MAKLITPETTHAELAEILDCPIPEHNGTFGLAVLDISGVEIPSVLSVDIESGEITMILRNSEGVLKDDHSLDENSNGDDQMVVCIALALHTIKLSWFGNVVKTLHYNRPRSVRLVSI